MNMDDGSEATPALTDVMVAQGALALEGFVAQVAGARMQQRGAWHVERVQAIYDALVNSGREMAAGQSSHLLAVMLAVAIDQLAGAAGE